MKFGYLGETKAGIESELITSYRPEDKGKWIIGYYASSHIPMIGFLDLRTGSSHLMKVQIYQGSHYDISKYRLLDESFGKIIVLDTDSGR